VKIENAVVFGFEPALRGMRNAKESWDRADSNFHRGRLIPPPGAPRAPEWPQIGEADLELSCRLIRAGGDHRKFLRQIQVWCDITIPRNVWQELDTYKVATVRNSCSTMHKLGSRELVLGDFENGDVHPEVLKELNAMGLCYREKRTFQGLHGCYAGVPLLEHMKHRLPEGFLQKATYSMSYETALRMYGSRKDHRMPQWSGPGGICAWIKSLPYMQDFLEAAKP